MGGVDIIYTNIRAIRKTYAGAQVAGETYDTTGAAMRGETDETNHSACAYVLGDGATMVSGAACGVMQGNARMMCGVRETMVSGTRRRWWGWGWREGTYANYLVSSTASGAGERDGDGTACRTRGGDNKADTENIGGHNRRGLGYRDAGRETGRGRRRRAVVVVVHGAAWWHTHGGASGGGGWGGRSRARTPGRSPCSSP